MYMPNAKTQRQGPNATYIPLAGVGVLRRDGRNLFFLRRDKHKFNFLRFFRYQHVGILALGDAKVLYFALGDAKVPNARYCAFWWNIGLIVLKVSIPHFMF